MWWQCVRAGYGDRGTRESNRRTYSVPGYVDGGYYHYICRWWIGVGEVMGSCGIDGLASSCRALQG